ncbi:MAG: hydroxymethylglutaryl-CoA reductase, degradative [Planctomycetota bacterium]
MSNYINGFSKMSVEEKLAALHPCFEDAELATQILENSRHRDSEIQNLIGELSENTISNFHLPYSIAPNFQIDGKIYSVPMVIEESSVVAAASKSAKIWHELGGFQTEIKGTEKVGQVHFIWRDDKEKLIQRFDELKSLLINSTNEITDNMRSRGGGIKNVELRDFTDKEPEVLQLFVTFETVDSMGANFINSCLEQMAETFCNWHLEQEEFEEGGLEIVMAILSNLTPDCLVKCQVQTEVENLSHIVPGVSGEKFARKFRTAVRIAQIDPHRATTHNKGIYNGIDAVVLATGNDFRAVEACGHAFASRNGTYTSLTNCIVEDGFFTFEIEVPMALGVVGGLTCLHPLAKLSLEILGQPTAKELMGIAAAVGLANNFSAVSSLTTTGIQHGHMKMHLFNILNQFNVKVEHRQKVVDHFADKKVSVAAVRKYLDKVFPLETAR